MKPLADVPVAILAGGLATRLMPLTAQVPKVLIHVAGKPFIYHQLELLRNEGFRRFVLCLGHLGEMVVDEVGNGSNFGVEIVTSFDGPTQIGTGGAIQKALPLLGDEFLTVYGDAYLPIKYQPVFESFVRSSQLGLMTLYWNRGNYDKSNVKCENGRIVHYDKVHTTSDMEHIDYGISVFRSTAFDSFASVSSFDLGLVHQKLISMNELAGYEVDRRFYEIGSRAGLDELDALLSNR